MSGFSMTEAEYRQDMAAHLARGREFMRPSTRPYPVSKYGGDTRSEATKQREHEESARRLVAKMDREAALAPAIARQSFAERLAAHRARKEAARA